MKLTIALATAFALTSTFAPGSVTSSMEFKMKQVLGVSIALLLFGSGVWANLSVGSLSQNTGAWVSHSR
jgi:hypothetical protein